MRLTWASQVAYECFCFPPLVTKTDTWIRTLIMIPHLCYTVSVVVPFYKDVVFIIFIRGPISQGHTVFALRSVSHDDVGLIVFHAVFYAHEFVLGQRYCLARKQINAIHVSRAELIWYIYYLGLVGAHKTSKPEAPVIGQGLGISHHSMLWIEYYFNLHDITRLCFALCLAY